MNHFLKIILFTLFNFTLIDQSYGQDLKYKAEALLDLTAIEYKALANNGDYDSVGFKVAISPLILGTVIWNTKGELIFPLQDYWAPVSQEMARSDLHRMEPLLESASLTAWEKRTVDASSLLYCRKDTMSLCFVVATEVLAQQLGHEQQLVIEQVLNKQPKQLFSLSLVILFILLGVFVLSAWQYFLNSRREVHHKQNVSDLDCSNSFKIAGLTLNPSRLTIQNGDEIIHIGDKDMKLLTLFAQRPDEVISKEELYSAAWQRPFLSTSRALDQHMMVLRRKINTDLNNANTIGIVHGQGYRYNSFKN